jgi:peptide/nickel transport system permease protein
MYVGLGAILLSVGEATLIGIVSGFFGGKVDIIIQRFVDAWMCFPMLFILLTAMAILSGVMHPVLLMILVLGLASGIGASRLIRSAVIAIKMNVYVEAAKAIGSPATRTLWKHILPNVMPPIIIMLSIGMGGVIMAEASLSFLGFGLPPPTPSWGGMLSGSGRTHMIRAPWMMLWPGIALAAVVYGINMFGDGVRDLLDPRLRGGLGRYSGVEKKRSKLRSKASQS